MICNIPKFAAPSTSIVTLANDMDEVTKEVVSSILSGKFQAGIFALLRLPSCCCQLWWYFCGPPGVVPVPLMVANKFDSFTFLIVSTLFGRCTPYWLSLRLKCFHPSVVPLLLKSAHVAYTRPQKLGVFISYALYKSRDSISLVIA